MKKSKILYFLMILLSLPLLQLEAMEEMEETKLATIENMFPSAAISIPPEIATLIFLYSLENPSNQETEWGEEVNYRIPYKKLLLVCKAWKKLVADSNQLLGKVLRSEIADHFSTYMIKKNLPGCNNSNPIPQLTKILTQKRTLNLDPLSMIKHQHFMKQSLKVIGESGN